MTPAPVAAFLWFAACALATLGCNRIEHAALSDAARPDVLLVTIDTLRADHVGAYGAQQAETPTLDALAATGARFETAVAATPLTLPSHASLLTGLDPPRHGVRHNGLYRLDEGVTTLAEAFGKAGYATGAVTGAVVLARRYGLDQGFTNYDDRTSSRRSGAGGFLERSAGEVTDRALEWLAAAPRPFFLWVHYYDPHLDYRPPDPFAERFASNPYDGEIAYVDSQLGRLLATIEGRESGRKRLVLVTSDHGESLGEHGESTHAYTLYDAVLRVPLVLHGSGVPEGRVVESLVRAVDVAPTLIELAGLPALSGVDGASFAPVLADVAVAVPRVAYAETLATRIEQGWSPLFAARSERYLLVRAPRPELYDVARDPAQLENLAARDSQPERSAIDALSEFLDERLAGSVDATPLAIDDESLDSLRALGYALPAEPLADTGVDPKDGLALLPTVLEGVAAYDAGDFSSALTLLGQALEALPNSSMARAYSAYAHLRMRQPQRALPHIEAAVRLAPQSAYYQGVLGDTLRQLGNQEAAAAAYRRGIALDPSEPLAQIGMQWAWSKQGDLVRAAGHASRAALADPHSAHTQVQIGLVWEEAAQYGLARGAYLDAVRLDPSMEFAQMLLAIALAREGRSAESDRHRSRAGALAQDPPLGTRLAAASLRGGDAARGERLLRELLEVHPEYSPARRRLAALVADTTRGQDAAQVEDTP
jgi:arylsulfatase A-like enzyme/Flp pilus assembly protein TadD